MTKEEFFKVVEKYANKKATNDETILVERFFEELNEGQNPEWSLSKEELTEMKVLARINRSIRQYEVEKAPKKSNWKKNIWRVAASIIIFTSVGLWYFMSQQEVKYITKSIDKGGQVRIMLTDGTVVHLNAESTITYPETFSGEDERKVELIGEAFFEVKRNIHKPFVIKSGELQTTVLGTSFNINAYPEKDEIVVTVASGKVQITAAHSDNYAAEDNHLTLTRSQQGVFALASGELSKRKVNTSEVLGWQNGILRFSDHTIYEMIPELERWYGVAINYKKKEKEACKLRIAFNKVTIAQVLQELELTAGMKYRKLNEDTYEILNVGCLK